jgi:hypothetical protein
MRKNPREALQAMDAAVRQGHEIAISVITYRQGSQSGHDQLGWRGGMNACAGPVAA